MVCDVSYLTAAPDAKDDFETFIWTTKQDDLIVPSLENLYVVGRPIVDAVRMRITDEKDCGQLDAMGARRSTPKRYRLW